MTGLISLLSSRLSRVFSSTAVLNHPFFSTQPSFYPTLTSVHDCWKNHSFDHQDLCQRSDVCFFNTLARFVIAFLPRSNCLLISWLQSLSRGILEPKKIKSVLLPSTPSNPYQIAHIVLTSQSPLVPTSKPVQGDWVRIPLLFSWL